MAWRGILREIQAASRRNEREAYRHRRELEKRQKQYERMQEVDRVRYEVEVYNNQIDLLGSVHKECGSEWDWHAVQSAPPPEAPARGDDNEQRARRALAKFSPSIWDRLFGRTQAKRMALEAAAENARRKDEQNYRNITEQYQAAKADWENSRQFAARVLKGDLNAYVEAIRETSPFRDMAILGSLFQFRIPDPGIILAELHVNGKKAVPSEIKVQLKTGKLSTKPMPKANSDKYYQEYVCGCVLRVARELFALLPVKTVIVTALGQILNTQTGHVEEKPVLSVAVPRDTIRTIQWESVTPSDTITMFKHQRMCFKKCKELSPVEPIDLSELRSV